MYLWYHCKIILYFSEDIVELHCMDRGCFVISFSLIEGSFNDLKHLSKDLDVSQIGTKHELYSEDNDKRIRKKNFKSSPENELDEAPF